MQPERPEPPPRAVPPERLPPRTRRGLATRERLLVSARQVLGEVGWARTRVEDVCQVAGTGHGTFYQYFGNRTELLVALVARHAEQLNELAGRPWTSGDRREDVQRVIDGFVDVSARDADVRRAWAAAAVDEPRLAELFAVVRAQFVARVRANLEAAVAGGAARSGLDVEVAATALVAMVEHAVVAGFSADAGGRFARERLVDGLTDLWVHAVYR